MTKNNQQQINRRKFLSKSFKAVISTSMAIIATKVLAYKIEPAQDSTDVNLLPGGSTPHSSHSSHSSRSWR